MAGACSAQDMSRQTNTGLIVRRFRLGRQTEVATFPMQEGD